MSVTHHGDLGSLFTGSNTQLVDGRLGDVGSLLGIVQLVLDFPETHCGAAHLLLLVDAHRNNSCETLNLQSLFSFGHLRAVCEKLKFCT